MTNPLHAAWYADRAVQQTASVVENVQVARDTFRLRLECPEIAERITPGQFVMLRLAGWDDPLLGRPLALYDTVTDAEGQPIGIDVVYLVVGKLTGHLAEFHPGEKLELWGPLGNGFSPQPTDHLIMVAGGIGQTPFVALGREHLGGRRYGQTPREVPVCQRVTLCYGARSKEFLAGLDDFAAAGVDVQISTDDGSAGHHGLVTDLLTDVLATTSGDRRVVCCGPEPMMEAVSKVARQVIVPCQVSLETPMACGIGICFSCVTKVRTDGDKWDYKRTCVDGPVFDAEQIVW
jgi:dihydroorotate dehydrogenase electron transfer subunit